MAATITPITVTEGVEFPDPTDITDAGGGFNYLLVNNRPNSDDIRVQFTTAAGTAEHIVPAGSLRQFVTPENRKVTDIAARFINDGADDFDVDVELDRVVGGDDILLLGGPQGVQGPQGDAGAVGAAGADADPVKGVATLSADQGPVAVVDAATLAFDQISQVGGLLIDGAGNITIPADVSATLSASLSCSFVDAAGTLTYRFYDGETAIGTTGRSLPTSKTEHTSEAPAVAFVAADVAAQTITLRVESVTNIGQVESTGSSILIN